MMSKKRLIGIAIIVITVISYYMIKANPPEARRGKPPTGPSMTVEVLPLVAKPYQVEIESFGTVTPRTQSALVAQVSGQIIAIADNFRAGGFFQKGDLLVEIDARDYQAEVDMAQANLLSAEQALLEEEARGLRARTDWQRLGKSGTPSPLVLREPQLAAAKAKLLSAKAQLNRAQLALERTQIRAPYDGRILQKQVDVGQVVSMNTRLADIYATDLVEVRLPIKNNDLGYLKLPEQNRDGTATHTLAVTFTSDLVKNHTWQGQVVRTESAIDNSAQQLYVIAQINDPFNPQAGQLPIKINQYVSAEIMGEQVADAIVIPNQAIYQGTYVYVVEEGLLKRKNIEVAWQNSDESIVSQGLQAGERLVITPLGQVSSGTRVLIAGEEPAKPKRQGAGKNAQGGEG